MEAKPPKGPHPEKLMATNASGEKYLTSAEAIEKLESEDIWKSLPRDGNQSPVPRIREAKFRRSEP